MEKIIGWVRWWNDEIGYGRVQTRDGNIYHIHHKQFLARSSGIRISVKPEQRLTFILGQEPATGRQRAEEIEFDGMD